MTTTERNNIEEHADLLYSVYCEAVGGVAFNGDPLPEWADFAADPKKQLQSDAWRSVAKQSRELENALASARASAATYREQYEASEMNIKNLMHYAKGLPDHVSISSPAIPIRDALILLHADKADIECKWEELCKAIGAHGLESDPLTGSDTNDTIHHRAMDRIKGLETALRGLLEAEEATVEDFNAKEIDGLEAAMNQARRVLGSQREAAESADGTPERPAENDKIHP